MWYADDATASGQLQNLKTSWNELLRIGPRYGYFANANKTWLIVEEEHLQLAKVTFLETNVQIDVQNLYKRKFMNGSKSC